jgi:hypothetical protein
MLESVRWKRKHMCEIAAIARRRIDFPGLSAEQRQTLELAGSLAKSVASGVRVCNHDNVQMAVSLLCSACLPGFPGETSPRCLGRRDWRSPCHLVASNVLVECEE